MTSTTVMIIAAVVAVVLVVAVIAVAMSRKHTEKRRQQAGELRERITAQSTAIERREAEARATEAEAARARAEADRKVAEAERLEADAVDQHTAAAAHREEHQENLRRADELDPDVDHEAPTTHGGAHRAEEHSGEHDDEHHPPGDIPAQR